MFTAEEGCLLLIWRMTNALLEKEKALKQAFDFDSLTGAIMWDTIFGERQPDCFKRKNGCMCIDSKTFNRIHQNKQGNGQDFECPFRSYLLNLCTRVRRHSLDINLHLHSVTHV